MEWILVLAMLMVFSIPFINNAQKKSLDEYEIYLKELEASNE